MTPALSSVVNDTSASTVTMPLSVIPATLPDITTRLPSIVEAPNTTSKTPLSKVTLPVPAPAAAAVLVVKSTSPVIALVVTFSVIALSFSEVTKLPVPPTVSAPTWVIAPSVAV